MRRLAGAVALPLLTALSLGSTAPMPGVEPEFVASRGSMAPNLSTGPRGRILLTWLEPTAAGRHALKLAVREAGRWDKPRTVREGGMFFVNWADFASAVESEDGQLIVHWLEKTAAKPYAYHVMLSVSRDGGATWSEPFTAHRDSSATEHGFVAMVPRSGGGAEIAWLDGRAMQGEGRGDMSLRTTAVLGPGRLGEEIALDSRTCECCQVALANTASGLVAAFRDRSQAEIRDIAVVRRVNGRWSEPRVAAADNWEHRACPVNGPALAAEGDQVTLVWYTGAGNDPRVYAVQSTDGAARFAERMRIDEGQTLGRVHALSIGDGATLVAWLDGVSQEEAHWKVRRLDVNGRLGPVQVVATTTRARAAGFARLARAGGAVLFAYTAPGPDGGVRVLRVTP